MGYQAEVGEFDDVVHGALGVVAGVQEVLGLQVAVHDPGCAKGDIIRNCAPLGPYSTPTPQALRWSLGRCTIPAVRDSGIRVSAAERTENTLRTFTCKPRPESDVDSLICAIFTGVSAAERRGNTLKQIKAFYLKTKARIWP